MAHQTSVNFDNPVTQLANTMSNQQVFQCLILSYLFIGKINGNGLTKHEYCNEKTFTEPRGIIQTSTNSTSNISRNCSWTIKTLPFSVIYIKILQWQLRDDDQEFDNMNCLHFKSTDRKTVYWSMCDNDDNFYQTLSVPANTVLIDLEIPSESYFEMTYTSYLVNCTEDELKCNSWSASPRNPDDACLEGVLSCTESCRRGLVLCGDSCYNVDIQRCDGVLDCPGAEDEVDCNQKLCPNLIQCPNETKCVEPHQICDQVYDCKNGQDEANCPNHFCGNDQVDCYVEKRSEREKVEGDDTVFIFVFVMVILAICFLSVISRCIFGRRIVRDSLEHPLDIPLPPFRGPGEDTSTSNMEDHPYTEDDFKPGGEIYEGFVNNMERIKNKRKNILELDETPITFVKPKDGKSLVDGYFNKFNPPVFNEDLAALATLKISREMCVGLRKAKSEEHRTTKLLFVDDKDDNTDESDEEEKPCSVPNKGKAIRKGSSKSDSNYLRKNRSVQISIV